MVHSGGASAKQILHLRPRGLQELGEGNGHSAARANPSRAKHLRERRRRRAGRAQRRHHDRAGVPQPRAGGNHRHEPQKQGAEAHGNCANALTAAMLNGTFNLKEGEVAKPCYKTADGKIIPVWMKLLRHVKNNKGQWINVTTGGDLGFTGNPGSGLIELVNGTNPPAVLRINLAKESITPKNTEAKPIIGAPTAMPGTVLAGGVPQMGAAPSEAYNEAQGEMPF